MIRGSGSARNVHCASAQTPLELFPLKLAANASEWFASSARWRAQLHVSFRTRHGLEIHESSTCSGRHFVAERISERSANAEIEAAAGLADGVRLVTAGLELDR